LLLLILLNSSPNIEAGAYFKACVGVVYDQFIENFSEIPDRQFFSCCNGGCVAKKTCGFYTIYGQCIGMDQSKFCVTRGDYSTDNNLANLCGGILGENPSANNTVGTCPSLDAVGNTLQKSKLKPNFSLLCCNDDRCYVPVGVVLSGANNNLANTSCPQYSLMCFQDNGGWGCTGNVANFLNFDDQLIGSCALQVVIPNAESAETTSVLVKTTTYTSGTSKITSVITKGTGTDDSTPSPDKPGNNNNSSSDGQVRAIAIAGLVISLLALIGSCTFFGLFTNNTIIINLRNTVNQLQNTVNQQATELQRIERQIEY
jgi:hypothetical protein